MKNISQEISKEINSNPFREGETYTRKIIYSICNPGQKWDRGGPWATGYATSGNKLIIFMNIGISGRTGHDYNNSYNPDSRKIEWCGKTNSNLGQKTFSDLIAGLSVPHFFARWNNEPQFTYLGIGHVISYKENFPSQEGPTMRLKLKCLEQ